MNAPAPLLLEGVLTPDQTLTYVHLPFDVPDNIRRLDVSYRYDFPINSDPTVTGGNTVDIGIFDARGIGFSSEGFRGWSGSARSEFFIALDAATPGYMPGPIQPGTWHISLGAYKVAPQGCRYQVRIALTPGAPEAEARVAFPPLLRLRAAPGARFKPDGWYRGELHCHTVNSDGDSTAEEIARLAESLGLDFLAITDHNNRMHLADLERIHTPLVLIPGYEVTTYYGHWNLWGDGRWVDFRITSEQDMARAVAEARAQGYVVSCNHPKPFGPDWVFRDVGGFQCVEVWNGRWEVFNAISLAFWEERLARGERLVAVCGSDHHFTKRAHIARLGHPTLYLYCEGQPSAVKLLQSLTAGHAFMTDSPQGPQLYVTAGDAIMGDTIPRPASNRLAMTIRIVGGNGLQLQTLGAGGQLDAHEIRDDETTLPLELNVSNTPFVRAQLVDKASDVVRALANPIYLT